MIFKRLLFVTLLCSPSYLIAQMSLYEVYQPKRTTAFFNTIEDKRAIKKSFIRAKINDLPLSSKKEITKLADAALTQPWALLTFNQFNEFKTTGNRVNYQDHYFARRNKLNALLIGELVTNNGRYLNEIVNGLGLICEETTWALPAHMSIQQAGIGLPDVNEPIIDLFAGQTATLLAYTKYLLGDQLDKYSTLLNQRIDFELKRRIFDPYLVRDDFWWMGFQTTRKMNNWNIFINTNVLSSALLAEDDPHRRQLLIEKSIRSVDVFLKSYPADGGCDEGPSYWGMAGGALIEFIDLLSYFSNQQLDFSKNEKIHQIGTYIYKVHIDRNYYVNFADADAANAQDATKIYKFGKLFDDQRLLQFAAYVKQINQGNEGLDLGNVNGFVNSIEVNDQFKHIKASAPQLPYVWLSDVQVLTARENEGSARGLFLSIKGGNNAESHNHNDVGNFVIYKDGTPLIVDAGVGIYTQQTFSANRYQLWNTQSEWHNCATINGVMQQAGASFKATAVTFESKGEMISLAMDMASAYPAEAHVNSWIRTFQFNKQKGILTLKEDFNLKAFKESSSLNFLVNGTVLSVLPGLLTLSNTFGKKISLTYNPKEFDCEVETKEIEDARLASFWPNGLSRLILTRKGKQLKGSHQIAFRD